MRSNFFTFAAVAVLAAGTFNCSKQQPAENAPGAEQPGAASLAPESGGGAPAAAPAGRPASGRAAAPAGRTAPVEPARPRTVTLEAGTPVVVRTTTALSTNTNVAGDSFVATLTQPLVVGDVVVAPQGAEVEGRIVEADKGGRVKGVASMTVRLVSVTTSGGERLEIATNTVSRLAPATKKKDAAKVGIGAGIGAAIGAIAGGGKGAAIGAAAGGGAGTGAVLATRGDPARVPAETVLKFSLAEPVVAPAR